MASLKKIGNKYYIQHYEGKKQKRIPVARLIVLEMGSTTGPRKNILHSKKKTCFSFGRLIKGSHFYLKDKKTFSERANPE